MFTLPTLPYSYESLEPFIDAKTVEIHHSKHHQTYVNKLNEIVVANPELEGKTLEELLTGLDSIDQSIRQVVLNNAGQVYNHNLYWESIAPNAGGQPTGALLEKIVTDFGSFDNFTELFTQAGITQFGSGWAWLSLDADGKLVIDKTSNAESPLMHGKQPILTMDVWEHAYYLNYQNRRPDYIKAFWSVINWTAVSEKFSHYSK
jgi:superoxide dismutase, Fe-Mn family